MASQVLELGEFDSYIRGYHAYTYLEPSSDPEDDVDVPPPVPRL